MPKYENEENPLKRKKNANSLISATKYQIISQHSTKDHNSIRNKILSYHDGKNYSIHQISYKGIGHWKASVPSVYIDFEPHN